MHRRFYVLAAFAVIAGAAAVIPACTDQGEGDRCDEKALNSGNDDCQSGLVCKHVPSFTTTTICCPDNPAQATTVVCSAASGLDSGPAPDTSTTDTTDAGADTSTVDSAIDTGADAGADTSTAIDTGAPDAGSDTGADANLDAPADG